MRDCVFCAIGRGEVAARIVFEDDAFVAFDDIHPQGPVHTLIIPREHHSDLSDGMSLEMIGRLFSLVPRVAELKGIGESGYRMIVNTGPDASQTVPHIHVHVLGGCRMVHGMVRFAENGGCH